MRLLGLQKYDKEAHTSLLQLLEKDLDDPRCLTSPS
jgi:hypothetical protein